MTQITVRYDKELPMLGRLREGAVTFGDGHTFTFKAHGETCVTLHHDDGRTYASPPRSKAALEALQHAH